MTNSDKFWMSEQCQQSANDVWGPAGGSTQVPRVVFDHTRLVTSPVWHFVIVL
jgi:hypothetical protein